MFGLNVDPRNPPGNPTPAELRALGVQFVRFTFKDAAVGSRPGRDSLQFYRQYTEALTEAGIGALLVLTAESCPAPPPAAAPLSEWITYVELFAGRAAAIAAALAPWQPAFQVWQSPDQLALQRNADPRLPPDRYAPFLRQTCQAIKAVNTGLPVITAGLVSGQPAWLADLVRALGNNAPVDAVAIHPYGRRPNPDWPNPNWGAGTIGELLAAYRQVTPLPLWLTEVGVDALDPAGQADYLRRFYQTISADFSGDVARFFWFCYSDGMAYPFGLVTHSGTPKPAYQAYRQLAAGSELAITTAAEAAVPLDSLLNYARYLEQSIVFGTRDQALQRQMETDLRWKNQPRTKTDLWRITQQLLAGSSHALSQTEIESLEALQQSKDLYGSLRSVVLATHQRTGALSGCLGVHCRISAETDANAATNIEAVMQVLSRVQPGNRLSVMDQVKATADDGKLRAPDIFETDVYGQHRNGLVDNHAWNLQRLVRAIRDRGYQDRLILIIRIDGPDNGANVNPFSATSLTRYELAIGKIIRYLETVLPAVPFKIALGNEPDLAKERQWSDPNLDPRTFIINQFAPATGNFMKKLARQRPDVTFICPALSANMKHDYLAYYLALFGNDRPENLTPAMHGYSVDVATLPGDQRNLLHQQAESLRQWGGFKHVSGTEIGSGNPFGDVESLSDKARFDDVVAWLLLSRYHQTPPGQDNNWSFRIDPALNDPTAQQLADVINRSKPRVLRNIRERSGGGLQILQGQLPNRPAYGVEYLSHNTPATMVAGQTNAVQITLRNTSYRTWPAAGPNPIRLGYHWHQPDGAAVPPSLWDDNRTGLPYDVPPGDSVTLNCNLNAPRTPGRCQVRWDVVEELVTWFAWQGVATLNIEVNAVAQQPPQPLPETPAPTRLSVSASHNNRSQGEDNLQYAIDNNPYTRWSSRALQTPGMWFQIDLGAVQTVGQVQLINDPSPRDYPRGFVLKLSSDGQNWATVAENRLNDGPLNVTFSPRPARYVRIEQTGSDPTFWWSIHDIKISGRAVITARASHNNVLSGADNVAQALDDNPATRWSSRALQTPGMWFEIDLNEIRSVRGLALDNAGSANDYPAGYTVSVATDRSNWQEVARNGANTGPLNITFSPRPVRYLYIEQTGRTEQWWWSIYAVAVKFAADNGDSGSGDEETKPVPPVPTPETPLKLSLRASHNSVQSGADNLLQAIDGNAATRWSSRTPQQPGMWFEIELNEMRLVSGVALDTAGSPQDYPRGYAVSLSTDRSQWREVARANQNDRPLDVRFGAQPARYVRIEQTGRDAVYWWSIHRVSLISSPAEKLPPTVNASHNNVLSGADNLLQALDGDAATRWSSRAAQQPGMWFEIDLNETRPVSGLALDSANSPNDYPRGYVVRLSTDRSQWADVARNEGNTAALDVNFGVRSARYIRIEQTGSTSWWWSIHRVTVKP
ncbi:MAG: hypothetical protein FOGNACKC_01770 [Anaerolineae bacterium]|nr:hypothetical protein [Anaerolineae bacterium]